jgi:hypothetical protein
MEVNSDDGRYRPWVSQSYYQHWDRVECCFISKPAKAPVIAITPDFIVQLQQGRVAGLHAMWDSTYGSSAI